MRERLILVLVGMTVAMIAMYGIPRAYVLAGLVTDQEQAAVERASELLAVVIDERAVADQSVTEKFLTKLLGDDASIEYAPADGEPVRVGEKTSGDGDLTAVHAVSDGGTITVTRSGQVVQDRISAAMMPLILMGLGLTLFSALVGFLLARWFSRPFGELATAADNLSRARFDMDLPRYSIPEANAIRKALMRASTQLDTLLRREREFAANASHQLRTPITALRLTLEDLTMWPETPATVADELNANIGELDRLSAAIGELLDLSRGKLLGEAEDVDLTKLVSDAVSRWKPHYAAANRTLALGTKEPVPARTIPGPVLQIVDVLVENGCSHGEGTVTVDVRREGKYLHVVVADEGASVIDNEVFLRGTQSKNSEGHGLGLTIAAQLANSLGGRLTVADAPTTTFLLVLPLRIE